MRKATGKPRRSRRTAASGDRRRNIKEVALEAGVSVATVSRTLAMPEVVAPETRRRVQDAIRHLGYSLNVQARSLRTSRSHVIVALVPDISNPFFGEIIRGIEQVAHQNRYSVLLGDTQYNREREQAYADMVGTRQADGLITMLPHIPKVTGMEHLPIVNACEYVRDRSITSVYVDNSAAACGAVEYLLTLGHGQIAFISGPMKSPISIDRDRGYELALSRRGIKRHPRLSVEGNFSVESGIRGMESLFSSGQDFTAVFCSNDEMAFGAIRAIKARGLRVPQDISVVGFDDLRLSRYFDPPLTTVAQPMGEIGREAMTMLMEILRDVSVPPRKRILPTQLVVRESTGPRKAG